MKRKFEHGTPVNDQVTNFSGLIVGYADYMTGCAQYLVQPKGDKSHEYPEARWFDEGRLTFDKSAESFKPETVQADENGSDYSAPVK